MCNCANLADCGLCASFGKVLTQQVVVLGCVFWRGSALIRLCRAHHSSSAVMGWACREISCDQQLFASVAARILVVRCSVAVSRRPLKAQSDWRLRSPFLRWWRVSSRRRLTVCYLDILLTPLRILCAKNSTAPTDKAIVVGGAEAVAIRNAGPERSRYASVSLYPLHYAAPFNPVELPPNPLLLLRFIAGLLKGPGQPRGRDADTFSRGRRFGMRCVDVAHDTLSACRRSPVICHLQTLCCCCHTHEFN